MQPYGLIATCVASAIVSGCLLPEHGGGTIGVAGDSQGQPSHWPAGGTTSTPETGGSNGLGGYAASTSSSGQSSAGGHGAGSGGIAGCIGGNSGAGGECICNTGGSGGLPCAKGYADCDNSGACATDTNNDPSHCSSCFSAPCKYPVCHNATCVNPDWVGLDDASNLTDPNYHFVLPGGALVAFQIPGGMSQGDQVVALGAVTTMFGMHTFGTFQVAIYDDCSNAPCNLQINSSNFESKDGLSEEIRTSPYALSETSNYWLVAFNTGTVAIKLVVDNLTSPLFSVPVSCGTGFEALPTGSSWASSLFPCPPPNLGPRIYPHLFARLVKFN